MFLHRELEENVYMHQLEGFTVSSKEDSMLDEKIFIWTKTVT